MAKKKRRKKKTQSAEKIWLVLLVLICLLTGVVYRTAEIPIPEPLASWEEQVKQTAADIRIQAGERLADFVERLPSGLREALAQGDAPPAEVPTEEKTVITLENLPDYDGKPYIRIYDNLPYFTGKEACEAYETYAPLDLLGRCGKAEACIGAELMPTEEREGIGMVKPSGWQTVRYDDLIDGKYLYNRCHLIGYQLTGENANEQNLITGTRYLNVEGMLPFENQVADYVQETGNHVLYRVTPVFHGIELVARGIQIEAWSVEDNGEGVCFNVYCYNVQPGVVIDYLTGESRRAEEKT